MTNQPTLPVFCPECGEIHNKRAERDTVTVQTREDEKQ